MFSGPKSTREMSIYKVVSNTKSNEEIFLATWRPEHGSREVYLQLAHAIAWLHEADHPVADIFDYMRTDLLDKSTSVRTKEMSERSDATVIRQLGATAKIDSGIVQVKLRS